MTKQNPAKPFAFLMEASMLGVGVGFDDKGADKDFLIYEPKEDCRFLTENPDTSALVQFLFRYIASLENF
jgi:hypothetical protein